MPSTSSGFVITPRITVCVVEALPKVVVFEPAPTALFPITIWFVSPSAFKALAVFPINMELLIETIHVDPAPANKPA